MVKKLEGTFTGKGLKFGIVISRFNDFISSKLLEGALDCLRRHEVKDDDVTVCWVPGSWEMPLIVQEMSSSGKVNAIIALGAVIRGATDHYQYVAAETTKGLAQTSLKTGVPVSFGVLTTDTIEQAIERAGTKAGNKGFDAALASIEMANLLKQIKAK